MPKVSVIIPTCNRARYLVDAIDSVLNQTYQDFDLIIVDDGSTDDTREAVKKYAGLKVRYFYKENSGISSTRNFGIKKAESEFIAFLDSDDMWYPDKLFLQVEYLNKNSHIYLCNTDVEFINGEKQTLGYSNRRQKHPVDGMIFKYVFKHHGVVMSSIVIRRKVFEKIGMFDENLPIGEDTDLFLRIARSFGIGLIAQPLMKRRIHNMNISKDVNTHSYRLRVIKKILEQEEKFTKENKKLINDVSVGIYVDYIEDLLQDNKFKQTKEQFRNFFNDVGLSSELILLYFKYVFLSCLGEKTVIKLRNLKNNIGAK